MTEESEKRELWVVCEPGRSAAEKDFLDLVSSVRRLADGFSICAVVVDTPDLPHDSLSCAGANRIYTLAVSCAQITPTGFARAAAQAVTTRTPAIFLMLATTAGRSIAPRIAALLGTGLTADCISLSIDRGILLQTRPAFGGNLTADIVTQGGGIQMATVRPYSLPPAGHIFSDKAPILQIGEIRGDDTMQFGALLSLESTRNTFDTNVVIAGGVGIGGQAGFERLLYLSMLLNASLGASRAAVNAGYAAYPRQIGLTGCSICPDLYLTFGISGAVQHMAGVRRARRIIAVNTDPSAPIFRYADYGVIGDWAEVCEGLIAYFEAGGSHG